MSSPTSHSVQLKGENATLKCSIHNFSTDDPLEFHAHTFAGGHTETGHKPCEMPGCGKTAHYTNKPLQDRALCQGCVKKIKEGY